MDDDSCVLKYIEIVPLDNFNNCSDHVTDIKQEPDTVKVYLIQIVTGVEVTIGNCFPDVWEILPDAKGGGNISQTEGKQFPIVTDNNSLYLFCYTS